MKNRKSRIIMGIMVGLVLFSSSVALLLYLRQTTAKTSTQRLVEVYVAAKDLKKGDLFDAASITKAKLPQSYINFTPLTDTEIISRYATVPIYKGEPIRSQKISLTKPLEKTAAVKPVKSVKKQEPASQAKVQQINTDTLNISLSVFKNNNTLLKSGDYVDIVSAVPTTNKSGFDTKYVALHVKINSFVSNGQMTKLQNSYNADTKQLVRAESVVLLMSPREIKNFLAIYYKTQVLNANRVYNTNNYGGQLWMVKTPKTIDPKLQEEKKRLMIDRKKIVKKYKAHTQRVKISYEK